MDKTELVVQIWLDQIEQLGVEFDSVELHPIHEWAKYKARRYSMPQHQVEATIKLLAQYKQASFDIEYMIHRSITNGYHRIMKPTNYCIQKVQNR